MLVMRGDIISRFKSAGKPVFAFDSTAHAQQGQGGLQPIILKSWQAIEKLRLAEPEERRFLTNH